MYVYISMCEWLCAFVFECKHIWFMVVFIIVFFRFHNILAPVLQDDATHSNVQTIR